MTQDMPPDAPAAPRSASPPPPPPSSQAPPPWWTPPKKSSFGKRIFLGLFISLFVLSIVMNGYLLVLLSAYLDSAMVQSVVKHGDEKQTIAVYHVTGVIDGQAATRFTSFYNEIAGDQNVKAVVLRVNSPGGGMSSSDQIYAMVKAIKSQGKPVVVSMGGLAASGGYYISAPADEIIAEPTTLTGSIGVILGWMVVEGTLEKIGVDVVVMKSSRAEGWKDTPSSFRKLDARQREYLQKLLDQMQQRFESVVIEGRGIAGEGGKISVADVTYPITVGEGKDAKQVEHAEQSPFNGKIYTADEAKEIGLIDDIGYEQKAFDRAAALAGLQKPNVVSYRERQGLLTRLLRGDGAPRSTWDISPQTLDRWQAPRLMMLWKVQ